MNKQKKTDPRTTFKQGQEVFLSAFLKKERSTFYICRARIEQVPAPNERQVYKVRIIAVGDRPIGGKPVVKQAQLLGLTVTKSAKEIHHDLPSFMCPPGWIEMDPNDLQKLQEMNTDGVIDAGVQHTGGGTSGLTASQGDGDGKNQRKRPKANQGVPARGHSNPTPKKV